MGETKIKDFERLMKDRLEWYSDNRVLLEMIKDCQYREIAFINPDGKNQVRMIKAYTKDFLTEKNWPQFKFLKRPYNMYVSVAKLENLPLFSYNPVQRREEMDEFNKRTNFLKHMRDYELIIDVDPKGVVHDEENHGQMLKIKGLLDEYQVHYWLQFTGKGFHFVISGEEFDWLKATDKPRFYKKLLERLKWLYAKNVDIIYGDSDVERRLRKIRYSFDVKTGNVCLPLHPSQAQNFDLLMVKPNEVKKTIFNRGIYVYNQRCPSRLRELCEDVLSD